MKDCLSMFLKLHFRVPPCIRSDQIFNAFVKSLPFSGHRQAVSCQILYFTPASDAPAAHCGRPASIRHVSDVTDLARPTNGQGAAALAPPCTVSDSVSYHRGSVTDGKRRTFYKCIENLVTSKERRDTKEEFKGNCRPCYSLYQI